jgi:hypothetical protein
MVLAGKGHLPVTGGTLDQSAWFLAAWRQLENDQNEIEAEQSKRRLKKHG